MAKKQTSEAKTDEVKTLSTSEVKVDTLTLEEYISQVKINPGLVVSFKYEASKNRHLLEPKSKEDWQLAFEAQSKRTYV